MSENPNDPQPVDPPVNTGGGGEPEPEAAESSAATNVDPPANTGGGN